jgi:15-cis-phytoene synthase
VRASSALDPEGADLYREAAAATAVGSRSFYLATRFFPPELERAAHSVYWFCRYTDDLVDEATSPEVAHRDLQQWDEELRRTLSGVPAQHPVLKLFGRTVHTYGIPHDYPLELIEGMRMDLAGTRYDDFQQLRLFCYRVASVVGLMMCHVIGFKGSAESYAIDLGIAMQLTNILRDIGEDLQRGRIYIPRCEMERFGYSEEMLRARTVTPEFRELMRYQVARARVYYEQAQPGIGLLDADGRFAVRVAADVYAAILSQIERNRYRVFDRRAIVPRHQKYWITLRALAAPAARVTVARLRRWSGVYAR